MEYTDDKLFSNLGEYLRRDCFQFYCQLFEQFQNETRSPSCYYLKIKRYLSSIEEKEKDAHMRQWMKANRELIEEPDYQWNVFFDKRSKFFRETIGWFLKHNQSLFFPLKCFEFKKSTISNAGVGVFTKVRIKKGSPISFFGLFPMVSKYTNSNKKIARIHQDYSISSPITETFPFIDHTTTDFIPSFNNYKYYEMYENKEARLDIGTFINDNQDPNQWNCAFITHPFFGIIDANIFNTISFDIWIVATRDIDPGEELFIPYGDQYWQMRNEKGMTNFDLTNYRKKVYSFNFIAYSSFTEWWKQSVVDSFFQTNIFCDWKNKNTIPLFSDLDSIVNLFFSYMETE